MSEYCKGCDISVMRHFLVYKNTRNCTKCGKKLKLTLDKQAKKKLTSQAMFAALDATVFLSLGNDMCHKTKEASAMLSMSSHMGKGYIHTVSNQPT